MDIKVLLLVVVVLSIMVEHQVNAVFNYNRMKPTQEEMVQLGFKCIPGSTVFKIGSNQYNNDDDEEEEDAFDNPYEFLLRRTHMNAHVGGENCKICVCSTDGKDENCWNRPVRNVNECIRISGITTEFQNNIPFDQERSLAYRIRRGGDTLCCSHPDGHRRHLHRKIKDKLMQMRRNIPKENLLSGHPGGDYVDFIVNNDK